MISAAQLAHHPLGMSRAWALLPLGFGIGWIYFWALRQGVARLLAGRPGALTWMLARLAAMVILLAAAAHWGAAALLTLFAGLLLARWVALGAVRPAGTLPGTR